MILVIYCQAGSSCRRELERCSYAWYGYKGQVDSRGRARGDCCAPTYCDRTYTPGVYTLCEGGNTNKPTCYGVCRK